MQPVKQWRSLASKQRATILTLVLFLFVVISSMPLFSANEFSSPQYFPMSELKMMNVNTEYSTGGATYRITYPYADDETFDKAVGKIIAKDKARFANAFTKKPRAHGTMQLHYLAHFHNERYVSLSFVSWQTIDGRATTHEYTLFYDRQKKHITPLADIFKTKKYQQILAKSLQKDLQKVLKSRYHKQSSDGLARHVSDFIINKKRQLVLVFQPGVVAKASHGVVAVAVDSETLRNIITKDTRRLLKLPAPPKPQPEKPTTKQALPSVNLTPSPIPQADPSGVDCATTQCLALTFDDGPAGSTPELLDILAANNAHATFFVLGMQAESYPDLLRHIQNKGHVIGNHTYDHQNLEELSVADAAGQINRTADVIQSITGIRPGIARAPYGAINPGLAQTLGLPFIGWSIDTQDWMYRDAAHVCTYIVSHAHAGGIILAHDVHQTSVEAMRCAIPQLIQRGFTLVTVPQLLGLATNTPPGIYSSR